jgi:hypothetical protein
MPGIIPVIGNVALRKAVSTSPRAWGARTDGLAELPCDQSGTQVGCRSGDEVRLSVSNHRRATRVGFYVVLLVRAGGFEPPTPAV